MILLKNWPPNERVKMQSLSPQTNLAIGVLREILQEENARLGPNEIPRDIEITSISDGVHSGKSKHYRGDAFDFGFPKYNDGNIDGGGEDYVDIDMDSRVRDRMRDILGQDFDVIDETRTKNHTHVEYDPKGGPR